ncbi:VPDSG-CTERM sorting domain-containing protein [Candidatus Pelagisphaera phototrophica]|uniref:VPDSG-CTERM sorting domain-containing protein n=1 Tax=Candidatus Pelagisphaera phototrophica TaxID=2684113 RepID=UPI0024B69437|nr:VPDSG-CTERM sorting domain-containing protein [Candidatus Pelagisphaera phototrophica]QXD31042.1 VPDSG-CTERM sorting domain-containing protein [Candidatus Pelagisphaera phototrophica]
MSFTNLQLTDTSFSVVISGNVPDTLPYQSRKLIHITNPNYAANPGFVIGSVGTAASSFSFSGSQIIQGFNLVVEEEANFIYIGFEEVLTVGSALSGTLTGSWSSTAFDPSAVTSLNFYWGQAFVLEGDAPGNSGTFLGSASLSAVPDLGSASLSAVPDLGSASLSAVPDTGSTAALLGVGVAALAFARRRLG